LARTSKLSKPTDSISNSGIKIVVVRVEVAGPGFDLGWGWGCKIIERF